jgi:hypothetical protein
MSQALDLASRPAIQTGVASYGSPNISVTVVLAMSAVGIALSLLSLMLPGWMLQPSDVTPLVLP